MKQTYRPKLMVKMTLSTHWQNKLLSQLSSQLGINESYPQPHVIYVREADFIQFLFCAAKDNIHPTIEQLKAEIVDLKKEPQITVVRRFGDTHSNYSKIDHTLKGEDQ